MDLIKYTWLPSILYSVIYIIFYLLDFLSNVCFVRILFECLNFCGHWKSIQFLRVTVRTAKYDRYLIQLMWVSILGTRFKAFNFSSCLSERLGGQVVRRRSRKAVWWLPWWTEDRGFESRPGLFFFQIFSFSSFFPLLFKTPPIIFNIPFRNFIQCRPKKWKKKETPQKIE